MTKFEVSMAVLFLLCLGLGVYGMQKPSTPLTHDNPMMTRVAWCTEKYARTLQPRDDAEKSEILSWCIRDTYGSTR
jgi:hypothetical protein